MLGDSLAVSPSDSVNFPAVLETRLKSRGLSWRVFNAGVRGDTTAGGLRRIDAVLAANRPDILILALGANDGMRGSGRHLDRFEPDECHRACTRGRLRVLLCGMQLPPINLLSYGRAFRGAFESVAAREDVAFVPFLLDGVALDRQMNGSDGIHPNASGAERIADNDLAASLGYAHGLNDLRRCDRLCNPRAAFFMVGRRYADHREGGQPKT